MKQQLCADICQVGSLKQQQKKIEKEISYLHYYCNISVTRKLRWQIYLSCTGPFVISRVSSVKFVLCEQGMETLIALCLDWGVANTTLLSV